eukprot:6671183-Lingulodinium_polyedra.AAC.1
MLRPRSGSEPLLDGGPTGRMNNTKAQTPTLPRKRRAHPALPGGEIRPETLTRCQPAGVAGPTNAGGRL